MIIRKLCILYLTQPLDPSMGSSLRVLPLDYNQTPSLIKKESYRSLSKSWLIMTIVLVQFFQICAGIWLNNGHLATPGVWTVKCYLTSMERGSKTGQGCHPLLLLKCIFEMWDSWRFFSTLGMTRTKMSSCWHVFFCSCNWV